MSWKGSHSKQVLGVNERSESAMSFNWGVSNVSKLPVSWEDSAPVRPLVNFGVEIFEEVKENELYLAEMRLIGWFQGFWPSLADLNKWIIEYWKPILTGDVQIYPSVRVFFGVVFDNVQDKMKVLCEQLWGWKEKHILLLKPWYPNFNPTTESFDKIQVWKEVSPLHYAVEKKNANIQLGETVKDSGKTLKELDVGKSFKDKLCQFAAKFVAINLKGKNLKVSKVLGESEPLIKNNEYEGCAPTESSCIDDSPHERKGNVVSSCEIVRASQDVIENEDGWIEVLRKKNKRTIKEDPPIQSIHPLFSHGVSRCFGFDL
ncbi:hypothetical protein SUGI_0995920 [Cryptomeria japonica]|nr:hypothetical protein SUGI_0995920 [Cryptomeria japonica]